MAEFHFTGAEEAEVWPIIRDFHYSARSPSAVRHSFVVREPGGLFGDTGEPVAAATYSVPISRNHDQEALELSRLVRREDYCGPPLSKFVSWTLRWLKKNARAPFVLSYADSTHGHHGGIYQACNFAYVGEFESGHIGFQTPNGFLHRRSCNTRFGTSSRVEIAKINPDWEPVFGEEKYLYVFPLREPIDAVLARHEWKRLPYPKPYRKEAA